jgi:hypothetical protein
MHFPLASAELQATLATHRFPFIVYPEIQVIQAPVDIL